MFVTCVYPPERALCRTPSGPAETPVMADCQPLACRNAALTPANRQALADHLADLDNILADGDRLAPQVRHRLEERRRETAAFLTRHTGAHAVNRALPDADTVKAAIDSVLEHAAATGRRPTVTTVERRLGIPHATFHRPYSDLIDEHFRPRIPAPAQPAPGEKTSGHTEANLRWLRQENTDLALPGAV
ncbi:hypothetical protein ACH4PR_50260 [Streptomyces mirabilis]|uniref:hypothetical protein n=1 Tax=Streptomyces mirabilis TaxID=68239 RepID=UPI003791111B